MAPQEVWAIDTEWGFREGRLDLESAWTPVVLCLIGLRSGRRLSFWGEDPGLRAFFAERGNDLFVAHYAIAEMKYLLRLGVPLPARWFDTFIAWRLITNRPNNLEAGLSAALHRAGLPHIAPAAKKELQLRIAKLQFDASNAADREEIIAYCISDCVGTAVLYERLVERCDSAIMQHWVEFEKAVARMELRGIPVDVEAFRAVADNAPQIRASLIGNINATWPVFEGNTFKKAALFAWAKQEGIGWPKVLSPTTNKYYCPVDSETLKNMEVRHPFIGELRQVRKTLDQLGNRTLIVDPSSRRHYYSTSVFRSVTGRNQPKAFIFSGPKWLRYLIVPESPEHVLVYVDYVAQEIGIAAALSRDLVMRAMYESSDCHMDFAIRAGAAPPGATKQTHGDVRKKYKTVNLGVLYGQSAFGIAARLGIGQQDAEAIVSDHQDLFRVFWAWSERIVQGSIDRGWIRTPCGWRCKVPAFSNDRTWMNWPMQATGGDIMRLTITYMDRQNVRILAPVHDGFLLSCRRDQLDDLRAAVNYACRTAVEHVLPGFPLRWEFTVFEERFEDDDGRPLWNRLQAIMEELNEQVAPISP